MNDSQAAHLLKLEQAKLDALKRIALALERPPRGPRGGEVKPRREGQAKDGMPSVGWTRRP